MEKTTDQIKEEIQKAIEELHLAEQTFNEVVDPVFIEWAALNVKTAQEYIDALFEKAKEEKADDTPGIQTRFGLWSTGLTNRVYRILSLPSA